MIHAYTNSLNMSVSHTCTDIDTYIDVLTYTWTHMQIYTDIYTHRDVHAHKHTHVSTDERVCKKFWQSLTHSTFCGNASFLTWFYSRDNITTTKCTYVTTATTSHPLFHVQHLAFIVTTYIYITSIISFVVVVKQNYSVHFTLTSIVSTNHFHTLTYINSLAYTPHQHHQSHLPHLHHPLATWRPENPPLSHLFADRQTEGRQRPGDVHGAARPDDFAEVQVEQGVGPRAHQLVLVLASRAVALVVHDGVAAWPVAVLVKVHRSSIAIWKPRTNSIICSHRTNPVSSLK